MNMDFNNAAAKLGIGGASVRPYRVGGTRVRPMVGAPAARREAFEQPPVEYDDQQFSEGGNAVMGLGETIISPLQRIGLTFTPIRPINPQELRCPSTNIGLFVENIEIQGTKFFANKTGFGAPIELFSEVSRMKDFFGLATIQTDTGVEIVLFNPTANPIPFSGAFWGTFVRI